MSHESPFPSARLSDPLLTPEHLQFLTVESAALRGRGDVTAFAPIPFAKERDLPLVLLLHGVYGSHWSWAFRGGAHVIAWQMIQRREIRPMILVMPSDGLGGASTGYLPEGDTDYEAWIMRDVVDAASVLIPGLGPRSPLFLAGYSMGGFGALRLGAKHAHRVRGISAHCPVTHLDHLGPFLCAGSRPPRVSDAKDADVLTWMRRHRATLPPLRFDCGRTDGLLGASRGLSATLHAEGIVHEFTEHEGAHDFAYYSARLPDTLRFVDRTLSR